jgi:hypothetical protein
MINRIFFIAEDVKLPVTQLPEEENVFYSVIVDPLRITNLAGIYQFIIGNPHHPIALTLSLKEQLSPEIIRSLASFLFLATYLRIENSPVINMIGDTPGLLSATETSIRNYCSGQGFNDILINTISGQSKTCRLASSPENVIESYNELLKANDFGKGILFIPVFPGTNPTDLLNTLKEADHSLHKATPQLFDLYEKNKLLEKENAELRRRNSFNERELEHQKQYQDILRSRHSTRELQDYYNDEYEVLPKWYKRFGHLVKVMMGKRTFRSLFRDDVKKYRN